LQKKRKDLSGERGVATFDAVDWSSKKPDGIGKATNF